MPVEKVKRDTKNNQVIRDKLQKLKIRNGSGFVANNLIRTRTLLTLNIYICFIYSNREKLVVVGFFIMIFPR